MTGSAHDDDVAAKGDDIRDQWEPCGLGICAANAGHEGTCAEASGWVRRGRHCRHQPSADGGHDRGTSHD